MSDAGHFDGCRLERIRIRHVVGWLNDNVIPPPVIVSHSRSPTETQLGPNGQQRRTAARTVATVVLHRAGGPEHSQDRPKAGRHTLSAKARRVLAAMSGRSAIMAVK
jgi:hypothetical protein